MQLKESAEVVSKAPSSRELVNHDGGVGAPEEH